MFWLYRPSLGAFMFATPIYSCLGVTPAVLLHPSPAGPGGSRPTIYFHIPQEHVGPNMALGTGFILSCLKVKVKFILRPTVSRLVCSGISHPSGTRDQFFFLFHRNYLETFAVLLLWGGLSDERIGL
jgi:hypothetical protein